MKERIISSLVGLVLLAVILFFYETHLFTLVMLLIALVATYELLNATGLLKYRGIAFLAAAFSILLPFAQQPILRRFLPILIFLLAVLFFVFVIYYYNRLSFEKMAMGVLFAVFVPLFFSCAVYMRDEFGPIRGGYFLFLALGSAWFCDTGAYFSGFFFGKHKMAPVISPKKTIEGAIGGVLIATALNVGAAMIYSWILGMNGVAIAINYLLIAAFSPFLALLGMLGDLVASVIKRQYGVKDYGHIMPGHGGVMDRFDSVLLTLPSVYVLVRSIDIVL